MTWSPSGVPTFPTNFPPSQRPGCTCHLPASPHRWTSHWHPAQPWRRSTWDLGTWRRLGHKEIWPTCGPWLHGKKWSLWERFLFFRSSGWVHNPNLRMLNIVKRWGRWSRRTKDLGLWTTKIKLHGLSQIPVLPISPSPPWKCPNADGWFARHPPHHAVPYPW